MACFSLWLCLYFALSVVECLLWSISFNRTTVCSSDDLLPFWKREESCRCPHRSSLLQQATCSSSVQVLYTPSLSPCMTQERCRSFHWEGPLLRIHIGISSSFSIQTCGEGATRWHDGKESKVITFTYYFFSIFHVFLLDLFSEISVMHSLIPMYELCFIIPSCLTGLIWWILIVQMELSLM